MPVCIVDNVLASTLKKGKRLDIVRRYLRMKYHVHLDAAAIQSRLKSLKIDSDLRLSQSQ